MSYINTSDGIKLYYEKNGSGIPIIFAHEFAGDHRSWEPQINFFQETSLVYLIQLADIHHQMYLMMSICIVKKEHGKILEI